MVVFWLFIAYMASQARIIPTNQHASSFSGPPDDASTFVTPDTDEIVESLADPKAGTGEQERKQPIHDRDADMKSEKGPKSPEIAAELGDREDLMKQVSRASSHENTETTEAFPAYDDPFLSVGHAFWQENPNWEQETGHTEQRQTANAWARWDGVQKAKEYGIHPRPRARKPTVRWLRFARRWHPPVTSWMHRMRSTTFHLRSLSKHHEEHIIPEGR